MPIAIRVIVVPKIIVAALPVVVLFSTTKSSTLQWACAYKVGFCLRPVDNSLIFILVINCLFNSVFVLWKKKPPSKELHGQAVKLSVVFHILLGLATIVRT